MTIYYYFLNWKKLPGILFFIHFIFTGLHLFGQNCLADKNAGANPANIAALDAQYNSPSPYTFRDMMGVNDAGQFQGIEDEEVNPISYLTPNMRAFHAMDYDFNSNLQFGVSYESLTKPIDTDGFPPNIDDTRNYTNFIGLQGMTNISAATEILNRGENLTWKEKIWEESDWYNLTPGMSIPDGIRQSFQNYTSAFIDVHAPNVGNQLVGSYEVGNELWDYPFEEDYHAMLEGAYNAFVNEYGSNASNWKMKLLPGSFNAASIMNTCSSAERDSSNCSTQGGSDIYYQMGDYLNVNNCDILSSFYAINTHAYPFGEGTLNFVHPEQEHNEFLTFKAAVAFRDANPIFAGKGVWLTETGYDSYNESGSCEGGTISGVGELSHAAMLLRIFMITSRYHLERVNFYMGFDQNRTSNNYHGCTYNSSGFWKLGTNPQPPPNDYPSARPAHGATPKPAFFAFSNFLNLFNDKVFTESLVENDDVYAYIIANEDGTDPYLVFWSPSATDDSIVLDELNINQFVNLPAGYRVSSNTAMPFSTTGNSDTAPFAPSSAIPFVAVNGTNVGSTTLTKVKRMPSYIKLIKNCPLAGTPCNDGNPNTENDVEDGNCNCGTPIYNCNVVSIETGCGVTVETDGQNINFVSTTSNEILIIKVYEVASTGSWTEIGTLCNDYNAACTSNSSIEVLPNRTYAIQVGPNCSFEIIVDSSPGGGIDNDGDGICSEEDCDDTNANIGFMQTPGTFCDDGNSNTSNDQIQQDGCTCVGDSGGCASNPDVTETGCGVIVGTDGQNINFVSATANGMLIIKVYKVTSSGSWTEIGTLCNDYNASCNSSSIIPINSDGTYAIQVGANCSFEIIVGNSGGGGNGGTDNDGDGICSEDDCDDADASIGVIQTPGTSCNDGNLNTSNDQIQQDGCTCIGVNNNCTTYSTCNNYATIEVCGSTLTASNIDTDVNSIKIQDPNTYDIIEVLCTSWTSNYQLCAGSPSVTVPNGIYNIKVERKNGQPQCLIKNVQIPGSFIKLDNSQTYDYKIVPNPATNKAKFLLDNSWLKGPMEIQITNLSGQIINLEKIVYQGSQQKELDLSNLTPGSYLVNVVSLVNQQKTVGLLIVK